MKETKENQLQEGETTIKDYQLLLKFVWKKDYIHITLIDGQDLFKIASLMSDFLRKNDIDHSIEKGKI